MGIRMFPSVFVITDVQGELLKVKGEMQLPFVLNKKRFTWRFLVIDKLDNEMLIGADFMKENGVILDLSLIHI